MNDYIKELTRIFETAPSKHEAHYQSRSILEDISCDHSFITAFLRRHLSNPNVLNARNYPVVALDVELNPYYNLVANCWIPLPCHETNISTKAIHHHGKMLLTTMTIFGPGYEHWLFTKPTELEPERELFSVEVTEKRLHALHDLAFVDASVPHLPLYPRDLTITLALWSSKDPTTWKDRVKRIPILKRNEAMLKRLAMRTGLARQLDLKIVEYFDFYPTDEGFKGMRERVEFQYGPNEDHLYSLFHVLQQTGNDGLSPLVEQCLDSSKVPLVNRQEIKKLLRDLKTGRTIEGRLSECHLGVPHAMFTTEDIDRSIKVVQAGKGSKPAVEMHFSMRTSP